MMAVGGGMGVMGACIVPSASMMGGGSMMPGMMGGGMPGMMGRGMPMMPMSMMMDDGNEKRGAHDVHGDHGRRRGRKPG